MSTIFALATARGRAGVAVIRVSGPETRTALQQLAGKVGAPRVLDYVIIRHPGDHSVLDHGMAVFFPGPHSFTGEDVAEFHLHGSPAVIDAVLMALGDVAGLRPAEAGEFTRRAFQNAKLDLSQIEGLADLIAAQTEAQRKSALRQTEGEFSGLIDGWRNRIIEILAHHEARLDFPDEDLDLLPGDGHDANLHALIDELERYLSSPYMGERLREGLAVAVVGLPNAGKSSLVNRLVKRDAVIVSEVAGTTRDAIDMMIDLDGFPYVITDTAGIRDSADDVEMEGVRRALDRQRKADLTLYVRDGTQAIVSSDENPDRVANTALTGPVIVVNTHADQVAEDLRDRIKGLWVSSLSGEGVEDLERIMAAEGKKLWDETGPPPPTRARHLVALKETVRALHSARTEPQPDLVAESLRQAAHALGHITGRIGVEEILDAIFSEFCIGK